MKNPIIILTGPTASGKTSISYGIAHKYNCEIICTDSMTVYRGMDIGTDKPIQERLPDEKDLKHDDGSYTIQGVKHHLLNVVNPNEEFNVAIFREKITKIIANIQKNGHIPLLVGGSVMYIDAFVYNYSIPDVKPDINLRNSLELLSTEALFEKLCQMDPDCEWTVDKHNRRRLIREIEVFTATGKPFAEQKQKSSLPENITYLAVDRDRDDLYSRIHKRVDHMFANGFLEEVKKLHQCYGQATALQAAGYKQLGQYIDNQIDLETAINKTKQAHRNYAKRQLTWLRKNKDISWIKNETDAIKIIDKYLIKNQVWNEDIKKV